MAVALDLVLEWPDLLAVTDVATFADVDIAADQLERRVGSHAVNPLDRALDGEQRDDLDQAADRHGYQRQHQHQDGVLLDRLVTDEHRTPPYAATVARGAGTRTSALSPRTVRHML